jgi:membrane fusion protein
VEIPQRSHAVGVLMPVGGMLDVVSSRTGQIKDVFVSVGQVVGTGHPLFTISNAAQRNGESAPDVRLRSLRNELVLVRDVRQRERDIAAQNLVRLQEESATAKKQLQIAEGRFDYHRRQLDILERRFSRWQSLLPAGHVSRDAFELEEVNLVRSRAEGAGFQQQVATYTQAIRTLARTLAETRKQLELSEIQHALGVERLRREIDLLQYEVSVSIGATEPGVVTQVLVRQGEVVRSGQALASLRRPEDRLQAWLYLPTSTARQLSVGQSVEILLDAYPHSIYGTQSAVVSSVSGAALLPSEVRAPVLLAGPVFEVRAELAANSISAGGRSWPLVPGTSFTAEIIQRRLKLYEWLFRSLRGNGERDV